MNLVKIKCAFCGKEFFRPRGRVNEAKKFGWKQYCSLICQAKARMKRKIFKCSNPRCNKTFERTPSDICGSNLYCSLSCAALINNSKRPERGATKRKCHYCGKEYKKYMGGEEYCSRECKDKTQMITKEKIIKEIKKFYYKHRRIPLKIEFHHYNAAQERFGSWNKAIKSTGFEPNPVKFSKKFVANDGHICDSFAEKIVDDWLTLRKIKHERNIPYPENKKLTADFVTKNDWIEFFGLSGVIKRYDELVKKKRRLCRKYKLSLIEIYPKDLFPVNHLGEIIGIKNT